MMMVVEDFDDVIYICHDGRVALIIILKDDDDVDVDEEEDEDATHPTTRSD